MRSFITFCICLEYTIIIRTLICFTSSYIVSLNTTKSTFSNYKPRKKKTVKTEVKKPVVKKPPATKKATATKKASKTDFTKAKQTMLENIPISIYGTGMVTMSGEEARNAINKVKNDGDWKLQFKKIRAKIDESAEMYPDAILKKAVVKKPV